MVDLSFKTKTKCLNTVNFVVQCVSSKMAFAHFVKNKTL